MRLFIFVLALIIADPSAAFSQDKISETCNGTETLLVGPQAPKTMPFTLKFSADLPAKSFCYDKCRSDQSYAISDERSDPIRLVDVDKGGQRRLMTFDRRTAILTDYQTFDAGLGKVVREASGKCKPDVFQEPAINPR